MKKLKLSSKSKSPAQRANTIFTSYKNNYYLLGGGSRLEEFSDIWSLGIDSQTSEGQWQSLKLKGSLKLPSRIGVAYSLVADQLYLHGGQNFSENKHFDTFYTLNLDSFELNEIKSNPKTKPDRRNSHSMVYDKLNERLIMFGGADEEGPLDTIYYYYIKNDKWEEIPNKFKELKAREMHSSLIYYSEDDDLFTTISKEPMTINSTSLTSQDPKKIIEINFEIPENEVKTAENPQNIEPQLNNPPENVEITKKDIIFEGESMSLSPEEEKKLPEESQEPLSQNINPNKKLTPYLFIIGGRTLDGISPDILAINLNKWTCKLVTKLPHGLCTHCSVLLSDEIYIYGGTDGLGFLNYLYTYGIKTGVLRRFVVEDELKSVGERIAAAMVGDEENRKVIIFGGSTFEEEKNDVLMISVDEIKFQNI